MSSQPLCRRYHTNSVGHHRWHRYSIICKIHDIISNLYDNNPQYSWHHMHYIWHVIYSVLYHIHYMCDITKCLYLWHHTLYVFDISILYGITHSVMTTQLLCNFTATMSDITPTVSVPSHPLDQFYQTKCMYDITATMYMTSYALHVTSHPQLRTSHHFMYDIRSTLSDLSFTVSLSSHPPYQWYHSHYMYDLTPSYLWHHIHYIYDIISTKYDITTLCVDDATLGISITSFALQMTTHPLYHTKPQYLWCHIHFRHDNTAPVSDIAPTVSMSSHHLHWHLTHFCMTSHPPSGWHHMNYI